MKEQLQQRLDGLKTEYESGQKMLSELEGKEMSLRNTLIRISGAIQVLEEELNNGNGHKDPKSSIEQKVEQPV